MFQNFKVDMIYYKTATDFELEFNLCGCCRMRLLTDKADGRKTLLNSLSRAVSRSKVTLVAGPLFGNDGIISICGHAIGKSLVTVENARFGIAGEEAIEIIEGATPLVTPEGYFGGCIIESGPQSLILLTDNKTVRKSIMNTLIHPYIEELSAEELKNNAASTKAESVRVEFVPDPVPQPPQTGSPDQPDTSIESMPEEDPPAEEPLPETEEAEKEAVPEEETAPAAEEPETEEVPVITDAETESEPETGVSPEETPIPQEDLPLAEGSTMPPEDLAPAEKNEPISNDDFLFEEAPDQEETDDSSFYYDEASEKRKKHRDFIRDNVEFLTDREDTDFHVDEELYDGEEPQRPRLRFDLPILIAVVVFLFLLAVVLYFAVYIPASSGQSLSQYWQEVFSGLFGK